MADVEQSDQTPLHMQASIADFADIDLGSTLESINDAELHDIEKQIRAASEAAARNSDLSAARAYAALAGVASFHFTPEKTDEPFSAMMIMGNRRSPIPDDFIGVPLAAFESIAEDVESTPLRARLCDLVWLLNRSNHQCGRRAAESYHELVLAVRDGTLQLRNSDQGALGIRCEKFLRRALSICRGLKNPSAILDPIALTVTELREQAIAQKLPFAVMQLSTLSLDFQLADPVEIAKELEEALTWETNVSHQAKFWSLASRAYHLAKDEEGKWRCRVECAESYFKHAESMDMAMLKSHWISSALAAYQGIPNQKERRTELRHALIDAQAHINEEMSQFDHPIDLADLIEMTKERLENATAFEKLGLLASVHKSSEPETLISEAAKRIQEHPLSSLFGKSQHDAEGKVIHKSEGGHLGEAADQAVEDKVAENQTLLRSIVVASAISPFLDSISGENYPSQFDIYAICENSPFIPVDRKQAYFEGIRNFLFGNQLAALNILVPQLENSIRHVLKQNDFDPTSFDTATQIQEDRPLTSIYSDMRDELEQCFGAPIVYEIENLFLKKSGPNIRNNSAHGLMSDSAMYGSDATYANWLIYRLCCIPIFAHWAEIEPHP